MPVYSTATALPRQELALAIVEGEGMATQLIGDKVLPDFAITHRSAHAIKLLLKDTLALRSIASARFKRAPGAKYERATATFSDTTLSVDLYGLELPIPNEVRLDMRGFLDVETLFARRFGTETTGISKEALRAAALFNTGTFGSATNSLVAYTVALSTTNSYIADTIAACRRLKAKGEPGPYVQVMSGPVYERIRQAATVQAYTVGTLKGGMEATKAMILAGVAEYGVKDILVGDAYQNTAADGADPSLVAIWSNTYIWTGTPGMSSSGEGVDGLGVPTIGGVGVTTYWEGWMDNAPNATNSSGVSSFPGGTFVESYYENDTESVIVRMKLSAKPMVLNSRAGDLIATQFS